MSEEKEILLGYLIGSISILRDMHIQFTEKSRNKLADKIMELLTVYEKQQKEIEDLKEKIKNFTIEDENIYLQFGEITEKKRWQDKIKAKIEEFEKQQKEEPDVYLCIKVLQSLLEKE